MIETTELFPGITLTCYPDHRFKHGCLSIQIVRPMCREEAALNALLPAVLLRGCTSARDLRDITLRLDDLYGASVSALVRRVGDYQTTGFYSTFIEDEYALPGEQVLAPMAEFLGELLLQPVLEEGGLCAEYVESEKKNLISTIESELNDKRAYAASRMLRSMCKADSFGIPRLGEIPQVQAIDPVGAWQHYQQILQTSPIEIFYVGTAPTARVADLMRSVFGQIFRNYVNLPAQTPFHDGGTSGEMSETMEVSQGKLSMGFVTGITNRDPDFAAMQVLNTIFGAGMTSKLFMNVREKMSLCYSIGSGYYGSKGIMTVSAGIDCDKEAIVKAEILEQLDACVRGEISSEELVAAKQAIFTGLRTVEDSPGGLEGYYSTMELSGMGMDPKAYMEAVEAVTSEQAARAAAKIRLHTTYFLKGVEV